MTEYRFEYVSKIDGEFVTLYFADEATAKMAADELKEYDDIDVTITKERIS